MARKKNSLSAFDNALNKLGYDGDVIDPVSNMDEDDVNIVDQSDDDIDDLDDNDDPDNVSGPDDDTQDLNDPDNNDTTPIPGQDNLNNNLDDDNPDDQDEPSTDADKLETQNVRLFFDAFAEELGWDVKDDEKPDSMEGLINYIEDTVAENSKPQYADDRIAQLDAYVKNGGKFEDFYNGMSQNIQYDKDMRMQICSKMRLQMLQRDLKNIKNINFSNSKKNKKHCVLNSNSKLNSL